MSKYLILLVFLFIPGLVFAQVDDATENMDAETLRLNQLNTGKSVLGIFNYDISNSDLESEPGIGIFDAISIAHMIPMAGSDIDEDVNASHGIVINGAFKYTTISGSGFPTNDTYAVNLGVGYGYNYGTSLRLYSTLNTTAWFQNVIRPLGGGEDQKTSDTFPEDSGFLRIAANWTPFGKDQRWGFHVGLDSPFADGAENAFFIGFNIRDSK